MVVLLTSIVVLIFFKSQVPLAFVLPTDHQEVMYIVLVALGLLCEVRNHDHTHDVCTYVQENVYNKPSPQMCQKGSMEQVNMSSSIPTNLLYQYLKIVNPIGDICICAIYHILCVQGLSAVHMCLYVHTYIHVVAICVLYL